MGDTGKRQAGVRRKSSPALGKQSSVIEGTALVALHPMTRVEMARVTKALETEGITDVRSARIILSRADAKRVASGVPTAIKATIFAGETEETVGDEVSEQSLERSLKD